MRALLLLLPCLLTGNATAQKTTTSAKAVATVKEAKVDWDGEWTLRASQSDNLDEQIDAHLKDLNFAMKLFWKKKLQAACRSFSKLDILAGDGFTVTQGRERPIDTPGDGTEGEWKRSDGEVFKATLVRSGATLTQTLTGDGYTLRYVYSMRKDGDSLALQTTFSHPKLDNPFTFKQVFKRAD